MSAPSEVGINVFLICLLVPVMTYALVKQIWNQPLQNGPGFFLGIEVPAGFYEGQGRRWMTGYHAMVAALYGVWAVALAAIAVSRRWDMTPIWAGGFALLFVPAMVGFQLWTRHKLGVNPPVRPVALALTTRRYSDYISWPMEALAMVLVVLSWCLLLRHTGSHIDWHSPLRMRDWSVPLWLGWTALGMVPGKMVVVRLSIPLPAEQPEEHYRYQDAVRRNWIRVSGVFYQWLPVIVLFGGALTIHASFPARPAPVWMWLTLAVFFAVCGYGVIVQFRGMRQLKAMACVLRPAGSWRSPFGRSSGMGFGEFSYMARSRAFQIWYAIWIGGILAFILYPLCKGRF
jgi:hypothetical protein